MGATLKNMKLQDCNLRTNIVLCITVGICGVACVAPAARHGIYTVLSAFNF